MSLEITGIITNFLEPVSGTSQAGTEWSKQSFIVETTEQYNNLYCFEVFGMDKVENLTKYQKVGDEVKVIFNVNTNEWKGKYFTTLSAWRIESIESAPISQDIPLSDETDDLPF